jgi:uncharacterized membrane protein YccF (DUF307 family)
MNFLGNLIWILCGGLLSAIGWWLAGGFGKCKKVMLNPMDRQKD